VENLAKRISDGERGKFFEHEDAEKLFYVPLIFITRRAA
jgi:hypothetical protein